MNIDILDLMSCEKIDRLCIEYGNKSNFFTQDCPALRIALANLNKDSIDSGTKRRRMALIFEIKISMLQACYELCSIAGLENNHLVKDESRLNYKPFDNVKSFEIAIRLSRAGFGLITRIRSIWDKIFLYVALKEEGDSLVKRLQNQKSKRRFFFKYFANGFHGTSPDSLERANEKLRDLETDFRTPELHGFGVIRNWVFDIPATWPNQSSSKIIDHWNFLNDFLYEVFNDCHTTQSSLDSEFLL